MKNHDLEPGVIAGIREALDNCEPVSEDWSADLLDAYDKVRADLAAARQAYELKVQDLARETARLGKLIDVLAAHGHSADDTSRRCLACSICQALRVVTGATALEPPLPLPVADGREVEQGQERSEEQTNATS